MMNMKFDHKTKLYAGLALGLVLVLVGLAVGAGKKTSVPTSQHMPPPGNSAAYQKFASFAGERDGTWTNSTFGSKGSVTSSLMVNPNGTASLTFDLGGMVFGLVDPPAKTFTGTYDETGIHLAGHDELFGDFTITLMADGNFTMEAPNVPAPGIDRVEAHGTMDTATYIVFLAGGTRAQGSVQLKRK